MRPTQHSSSTASSHRNKYIKNRNSDTKTRKTSPIDDKDNDDHLTCLSSSGDESFTGPISSILTSMPPCEDNNFLQVQNFLNCFDERDRKLLQNNNDNLINTLQSNNCVRNLVSQTKSIRRNSMTAKGVGSTNCMNFIKSSPSVGRPKKFTISTKFLRKSRSKLRTLSSCSQGSDIMSSSVSSGMMVASSIVDKDQIVLMVEESNAKFKDFSIDSLLNK